MGLFQDPPGFPLGTQGRAPLADRMRPARPDAVVGQSAVIGPEAPLRSLIQTDRIPSAVFWGPPGCGKTTVARIILAATKKSVVSFSAVVSGTKDIRAVLDRAARQWRSGGAGTIVFIDELHHFNKTQQDIFLPHVEEGCVTLLATTTENPSFHVIGPLLSRCQVFTFSRLEEEGLVRILRAALEDAERGIAGPTMRVDDAVLSDMAALADGDARRALNLLEVTAAVAGGKEEITEADVRKAASGRTYRYDRDREEHYNVISAFIKSMRGSDPHAAVYWLARMLESGEEPLFIARRLVIFASEDVGNADPQAIQVAVSAMQAVDFVGMPEGVLPLAQATTYLASAPKSNASYKAYLDAKADVAAHGSLDVPLHLRNAVTDLMKRQGYGHGYVYPHDAEDGARDQSYLPDVLRGKSYYRPKSSGYEKEIADRLQNRIEIRGRGQIDAKGAPSKSKVDD